MLQAANTDLFNPLVSLKLTIVSVKIYHFLYESSQQSQFKVNWRIFIFYTISTGGINS